MERKTRQIGERRSTVSFEAKCGTVATKPSFKARVTQISTTGLRLRTGQELPVGTLINIAFDADNSPPVACAVQARVVRVLPGHRPEFEYGLAVVDDLNKSFKTLAPR